MRPIPSTHTIVRVWKLSHYEPPPGITADVRIAPGGSILVVRLRCGSKFADLPVASGVPIDADLFAVFDAVAQRLKTPAPEPESVETEYAALCRFCRSLAAASEAFERGMARIGG